MVIQVLKNKYKTGCGIGINKLDCPGILEKLNFIIEWDKSEFPARHVEVGSDEDKKIFTGSQYDPSFKISEISDKKYKTFEDREFLGSVPELKPGDCFYYNGQFLAIDSEDRIVLMVTSSGWKAIERLWEDEIEPEYLIKLSYDSNNEVEFEELTIEPDFTEFNTEVRLPFNIYSKWRLYYLTGRELTKLDLGGRGSNAIKCKFTSQDYPMTFEFIMTEYCAYFRDSELDEEDLDIGSDIVQKVIAWFFENTERKVNPLDAEKEKLQEMDTKNKLNMLEGMMK